MSITPRRFSAVWLAEVIRLRESRTGPYLDRHINRQAIAAAADFPARLLYRAQLLGQREGLITPLNAWIKGGRLTLVLLILFAVLTGLTTALGTLTQEQRQINLFITLIAFLGLPTAAFLFWLVSIILPHRQTTTFGNGWLWLTQRLTKTHDNNRLIGQALVGLLARHRILAPLLGSISHLLWLVALSGATLTTLGLLSTRRYAFNWETTILSPDAFVQLVKILGWLPAKLGFTLPDDATIRLSDGFHQLPDIAQTQWSSWLIGSLICYGVLPRLIALCITFATTCYRLRKLRPDPRLPGFLELKSQLEPTSAAGTTDAPAPKPAPAPPSPSTYPPTNATVAIVGIELAGDLPWPPQAIDTKVADLGVIDSRHQRQQLLAHLQEHRPERLLCVCDPYQTPDRGTQRLLTELQESSQTMRIFLYDPTSSENLDAQITLWRTTLAETHPDVTVTTDLALTWQWLQEAI